MQEVPQAKLPIRILALRTNLMQGKLLPLFLSLLMLLSFYPFFEEGLIGKALLNLLASLIFLTGVYMLSSTRRRLLIGLLFAIPALTMTWINVFISSTWTNITGILFEIAFYGYIAYVILRYIIRAKEISKDEIFGAISVYLLVGIMWAGAYSILETVQPNSFYLDPARNIDHQLTWNDLLYYSFITMMTVGYGDITPVTTYARSFAILQAAFGVLYIAISIARLVGIYSARPAPPKVKDFKLDEFIKNI